MRRLILIAMLAALAGCATTPKPKAAAQLETLSPSEQTWRATINPADSAAIDALPATWSAILAAKPRGADTVAAQGPLLDPAAALDHPELSPGSYRCRVVRLWKSAGHRHARAFTPYFCFVHDEKTGLSFAKQTGSDLPSGYLYADGDRRYVFLGAKQRKPGDVSLGYGVDAKRDVVGVIERFGAFRWRMIVPRGGDGGLDIYELTPVPADQQPS